MSNQEDQIREELKRLREECTLEAMESIVLKDKQYHCLTCKRELKTLSEAQLHAKTVLHQARK